MAQKIIFFDFSKILKQNNVEISFHSPVRYKKIIEQCELNQFYTFINAPEEDKIHGYYRYRNKNQLIGHIQGNKKDWKFIKPSLNLVKSKTNYIIDNPGISHNFAPFYDTNPKCELKQIYKAVGGQHLRDIYHKKVSCKQNSYIKFENPKFKSENIVDNNPNHTCGYNGLYTLSSKNAIDWKLNSKIPILNGLHEGQKDSFRGWSEFDSHCSALYLPKKEKYFIYTRANLKKGIRHIQVTSSKDFVNWEPFKLIEINVPFNMKLDNYYQSNISLYPHTDDVLIGFPTFYQNDKNSIKNGIYSFFSHDGLNWICGKNLIKTDNWHSGRFFKNGMHSCNGLVIKGDKMFMFVLDNYCQFYKNKPANIIAYSIRLDGFCSISSKNQVGKFFIKLTDKPSSININFKTNKKSGYVKIAIYDENYDCIPGYTFEECGLLTGDHIAKEITWNKESKDITNEGYLSIELKDADIYSITLIS